MPGDDAVSQIGESVYKEQPHGSKMPLERSRQPAAKRPVVRKPEAEKRRRVINPPPRYNHDQYRKRIDPVRYADGERMDFLVSAARTHVSLLPGDTNGLHICRNSVSNLTPKLKT